MKLVDAAVDTPQKYTRPEFVLSAEQDKLKNVRTEEQFWRPRSVIALGLLIVMLSGKQSI
jgi:hypothetical protein